MDDYRSLKVTTQAASVDLISLANLKAALNITDTSLDAFLQSEITAASGVVAAACNRTLVNEVVEETIRYVHPYRRRAALRLTRYPIVAVSMVTVDGVDLSDSDYEVVNQSGFLQRLSNDGIIQWSGSKVVVAYSGGFTLGANVPSGLSEAVTRMVKAKYYAQSRDPMIKGEDVVGVGSTQYWVGSAPGGGDAGLPADIMGLISPFRELPV
ncbi:MAG TPA: phage head-tail connector protein [Alphaproteobacteria bacterium]|jgi:hypothetical protein